MDEDIRNDYGENPTTEIENEESPSILVSQCNHPSPTTLYHENGVIEDDCDLVNDTEDMIPLPSGFVPAAVDVVVGTGREAKFHSGSGSFLKLLKEQYLERYSNAKSKLDKTLIISEIINAVRENSPTGTGFVKKLGNRWYQVEEHLCREKASQSLRNLLHKQYRSSVKSKKHRRCIMRQEIDNNVDVILHTSQSFLSRRISELEIDIEKKGGAKAPETDVLRLFSQANTDILEGLKNDSAIRKQLQLRTFQSASSHRTASDYVVV